MNQDRGSGSQAAADHRSIIPTKWETENKSKEILRTVLRVGEEKERYLKLCRNKCKTLRKKPFMSILDGCGTFLGGSILNRKKESELNLRKKPTETKVYPVSERTLLY